MRVGIFWVSCNRSCRDCTLVYSSWLSEGGEFLLCSANQKPHNILLGKTTKFLKDKSKWLNVWGKNIIRNKLREVKSSIRVLVLFCTSALIFFFFNLKSLEAIFTDVLAFGFCNQNSVNKLENTTLLFLRIFPPCTLIRKHSALHVYQKFKKIPPCPLIRVCTFIRNTRVGMYLKRS